jgi:hypothetical protein
VIIKTDFFFAVDYIEGAGSIADKRHKTWQRLVLMRLEEIGNHRFASVFQNPIKDQDAPGYYNIVKQPMDLKTIKKRLRDSVCLHFCKSAYSPVCDTNSYLYFGHRL